MGSSRTFTASELKMFVGIGVLVGAAITGLTAFVIWKMKLANPPTNTPIVVRGGAMTFRSKNQVAQSGGVDCFPLNGTHLSFYKDLDSTNTPGNQQPDGQYSLSDLSKIDFAGFVPAGYNSSGTSESVNGVTVQMTQTCNGSVGATLAPINGDSSFYHNRDAHKNWHDEDGSYVKRFWDKSCNQNSETADEDTCEHLSAVYLYFTPAAGGGTVRWDCMNGECEVRIGN
jgi:hypothetical protein